jgi:hypothetical protein
LYYYINGVYTPMTQRVGGFEKGALNGPKMGPIMGHLDPSGIHTCSIWSHPEPAPEPARFLFFVVVHI